MLPLIMTGEDLEEFEKEMRSPSYVEAIIRATIQHMDQQKFAFEENFQLTKELINNYFEAISEVLDLKGSGSIAAFVIAAKDEFTIVEIWESIIYNAGWNKNQEEWARKISSFFQYVVKLY